MKMRPMGSAVAGALLCALAALLPGACVDDPVATPPGPITCDAATVGEAMVRVGPAQVAVHLDAPSDAGMEFVRADLEHYLGRLWGGGAPVAAGVPAFDRPHTIWITSSETARDLVGGAPPGGYTLQLVDHQASRVLVAYGAGAQELSYAAYALLEELGARFFHPMQDLVPDLGAPHLPATLDLRREPAFATRGLHVHLLHPIEYFDALHEPGDANLAEAARLVDWLARTGQNHLQYWIVNHPDPQAFREHCRKVVDYAHTRGLTVGVVVQLWGGSSTQNSYELVSEVEGWQTQLESQLDSLMEVPWDVVEMGLGEFLAGDAASIVQWLDHATAYMAINHPGTQLSVQNHVGDFPELWVDYQGSSEYFYHLPQHCDERLANNVHTVFLFDLYREYAGYGHEDFHLQRQYLLEQLATTDRKMRYIPESGYWVTADVDVPAFLPMYLVARWNDIHGLDAETRELGIRPLDGHVLYSSGHEWGYWMTDYLTARMAWDATAPLEKHLAHVARAFGGCGAEVEQALLRLIELQTKYLFDERLIAYLSGEDLHDDLGYLAGFVTTPRRLAFEEVFAMAELDRAAFEATVVHRLEEAVRELGEVDALLARACRRPDETLGAWCRELVDGAAITRLRLDHSRALYAAVIAAARGADASHGLDEAGAIRERAAVVVQRRAADYRFDAARLVESWENPTAYDFGYLRQAHTLCYWHRQAEQAASAAKGEGAVALGSLPTCLD
jgi:hypothetical protein